MTTKQTILASVSCTSLLFAAIAFGFETASYTPESCVAMNKRYVMAHYSEDYPCPRVDAKGNTTLDVCENTWSKLVSDVIHTRTLNGKGQGTGITINAIYYNPYPDISQPHSQHNLEGYEQVQQQSVTQHFTDGSHITRSSAYHLECLITIDKPTTWVTWYGVKSWVQEQN